MDYDQLKIVASEAIDLLKQLDHVSKVFEEQNAFNAICFIGYIMRGEAKEDLYKIFDLKNCSALFIEIFKYFYKNKNELNLRITTVMSKLT